MLTACSGSSASVPEPTTLEDGCAHVVEASIVPTGTATYRVTATIASADTGWNKYADLFVVRTPRGFVLRKRVLEHPHVDEQPFTRSLTGLSIPEGEDFVEIAASDSLEGFCGQFVVLEVPRS